VVGESALEKKVRANHGHLSFHPIQRVQSAKAIPNFSGNNTWYDKQFGAVASGSFNPADFRNRDQISKIDIGYEQHHNYKAKPADDPFNDSSHAFQRMKDQNFSDIFHNKSTNDYQPRPKPNLRKPDLLE